MYIVGEIINTHGIKGEVKVKQVTDFTERFAVGNTLYYATEMNEMIPLTIQLARRQQALYLLLFEQFDSLDDVVFLKGKTLYIKEEQLTPLATGSYYYHEIIGCTMYTTTGEKIGEVVSILSPGANDVWIVEDEKKQEHFIPYIPPVVKEVDIDEKKIVIELMEGLIE